MPKAIFSMIPVSEILKKTKGKLINGNSLFVFKGVSIDSRTIKKGELFIAIKGDRYDGHRFIREAVRKGAAGLIISKKTSVVKNIPTIYVKNTIKALGQTAQLYRRRFNIPIIAVTGSAGKTTTKNLIAAVLSSRYKVLKSLKSENNEFGAPLTLLRLNDSYDVVVLELGTNRPGEIRYLSRIAQPTISVLTNIGESHLERLRSSAGVFREKFNMVKNTDARGTIIFNKDDKYLRKIAKINIPQKKIGFSIDSKSSFRAYDISTNKKNHLNFKVSRKQFRLQSPAVHNIYNALAAICCGRELNLSYNNISTSIYKEKFREGRFEILHLRKIHLIDDTYNSNPVSFRSAVETLSLLKSRGRKILVCGDMLELGKRSLDLHKEAGEIVAKSSIDCCFAIGSYAEFIIKAIRSFSSSIELYHSNKLGEIHHCLRKRCQADDVVLVKGSRGMHMERTVDYLKRIF